MKSTITKAISLILAVVMVIGLLPASALAAELAPGYDPELVAEIQALCGDSYDAEKLLDRMYDQGLVDKKGNLTLQDSFDVDGTTMTADELKLEAVKHDADDAVAIDGVSVTWGEIQTLLGYYDKVLSYQALAQFVDLLIEIQCHISSSTSYGE
jgi:hypothetical protein